MAKRRILQLAFASVPLGGHRKANVVVRWNVISIHFNRSCPFTAGTTPEHKHCLSIPVESMSAPQIFQEISRMLKNLASAEAQRAKGDEFNFSLVILARRRQGFGGHSIFLNFCFAKINENWWWSCGVPPPSPKDLLYNAISVIFRL